MPSVAACRPRQRHTIKSVRVTAPQRPKAYLNSRFNSLPAVSYDSTKIQLIFKTYKRILPVFPIKIALNSLKLFIIIDRSPRVTKTRYWFGFVGISLAVKVHRCVFIALRYVRFT